MIEIENEKNIYKIQNADGPEPGEGDNENAKKRKRKTISLRIILFKWPTYRYSIQNSKCQIQGQKPKPGFRLRRLRKCPKQNDLQKLQRLIWCQRNRDCDFKDYIFVDETTIVVYDQPIYHLRLPSSRPEAIPSSSKFECKIHVWGGISYNGATEFALFKCTMDSELYKDILAEYLIPFVSENNSFNFKLHQDNDPKHKSDLCCDFLERNSINWIRSPPKSPDLNPIEMVWNELKDSLRKKGIKNEQEAVEAIFDFQKSLSPSKCQSYINHLKKVIEIVIEKNGEWSNH